MSRVYNFSAGPAVLPEEVLKEAQEEMCIRDRLYLEVRIVEAVTEEVDQIRDNRFRAFTLKQLRQMVVSRRKELNKNLADNTDTRFLFIGDRNVVEIANHRAADLFEAGMA